MTHQEIINLINTYIKANGQGDITGSRLNTVLNALADYSGVDSVDVTTLPAGSEATAYVNDNALYLGIPKGKDGQDGQNAVNPFKGWFTTDNIPTTGQEGDYCNVSDTSVTPHTVTIYRWNTTQNAFVDTGEVPDTANGETFASSEELNKVAIDDSSLMNPANPSDSTKPVLAKAKDVMHLTEELFIKKEVDFEKASFTNRIPSTNSTTNRGRLYLNVTNPTQYGGSYIFPVNSGEIYCIEKNSSSNKTVYAYLSELTEEEWNSIFTNTTSTYILEGKLVNDLINPPIDTNTYEFYVGDNYLRKSPRRFVIPQGVKYLIVRASEVFRPSALYQLIPKSVVSEGDFPQVVSESVFGKHIINVNDYPINYWCISTETLAWFNRVLAGNNDGKYYKSIFIPVVPGQVFTLKKTTMSANNNPLSARYAFLSSIPDFSQHSDPYDPFSSSDNLVEVEGQKAVYLVDKTTSPVIFQIPQNCGYLYLQLQVGSNHNATPDELSYVMDFIQNINLQDNLMNSLYEKHYYNVASLPYLGWALLATGSEWFKDIRNRYQSVVLKVQPNQTFTIVQTKAPIITSYEISTRYAFLPNVPDFSEHSDGQRFDADIIAVNGQKIFAVGRTNSPQTFIIPEGCEYLYIQLNTGYSNQNPLPCIPDEVYSQILAPTKNDAPESSDFDFNDEYIRSSAIGLAESNPVPLITDNVYICNSNASSSVKDITIGEYFSTVSKVIVKMNNSNTNQNPSISIDNGQSCPIIYNGQIASNTNKWFEGELLWLQFDGTNYILTSYDKTQIKGTNSVAVKTTTEQQNNVLKLANRFRFLKWTPKIGRTDTTDDFVVGVPKHTHIGGYNSSYRDAVEQEYGIPYSSVSQDMKYVGMHVSFYTFLSAVNNKYSLLYTELIAPTANGGKSAWHREYRSSLNTPNGSSYFGTVCCGFTASATGCKRNWDNNEFQIYEQGVEFVRVSDEWVNPQSLRVGDVLDYNAHSIVIYQIFQDVFTGKITHVRFAESTSVDVQGIRFCLEDIDAFITKRLHAYNYVQYRYIKLYNNVLTENKVLDELNLPSDPYDIKLNYSVVSNGVTNASRLDKGQYDEASQINSPYSFSNEICTIAGDKATFPIGEYSIGNIIALNYNLDGESLGNYDRIRVYKRENESENYSQFGEDIILDNIQQSQFITWLKNHTAVLPRPVDETHVGQYKACLCTNSVESDEFTYWEVVDNPMTVVNKGSDDYEISWEKEAVAIQLMYINEANGNDPDPYFSRLPNILLQNRLISLSDSEIKQKSCILKKWRFVGLDLDKLYIRIDTVGIYGITGVYYKFIEQNI